jgi:alanine-alpha-ketoisovalerate/valine-pyruvate aminotransferase
MAKKTQDTSCLLDDSYFMEYCSTAFKDIKEIFHNNINQCHVPLSITVLNHVTKVNDILTINSRKSF